MHVQPQRGRAWTDSVSGFSRGAQGCEESFELFAAFSAQVEVFLDQRHGLGGVETGQLHGYEAIQLLEALVAADLAPVSGLGYLPYHRFENSLVYGRSFVLGPIYAPQSGDAPVGTDLTSGEDTEHVLRREPLCLHSPL